MDIGEQYQPQTNHNSGFSLLTHKSVNSFEKGDKIVSYCENAKSLLVLVAVFWWV